jgi:hypothetical protein
MSITVKAIRLGLFVGAALAVLGLASANPSFARGKDEAVDCAHRTKCFTVDGEQQKLYREAAEGPRGRDPHREAAEGPRGRDPR